MRILIAATKTRPKKTESKVSGKQCPAGGEHRLERTYINVAGSKDRYAIIRCIKCSSSFGVENLTVRNLLIRKDGLKT